MRSSSGNRGDRSTGIERVYDMRIANIIKESIVDGPGIRVAVFVQGCYKKCEGCHNESTWDMAGGQDMTITEVISQIEKDLSPLHSGITFSGGEPFLQADDLAIIANYFNKDLVVYTGFKYEELINNVSLSGVHELLKHTNLLVDDQYIKELRDISLTFKGSKNQRIIEVQKSIKSQIIIEWPEF